MGSAEDETGENSPGVANFPAEMLASLAAAHTPSAAFAERPTLRASLKPFHPLNSAALVAGLLVEPSVQANTIRIEGLVHLLLTFAEGTLDPNRQTIDHWLNTELGSSAIALIEDPPEDVFVSNVTTARGNFRVFEGVWESSDFYLQRLLNIVELLPNDESSRQLKREIFAILKISEEIAMRCRLARFSAGGGNDKQKLRLPSLQHMKLLLRNISFSATDLEKLQIHARDLEPFIFQSQLRMHLVHQSLGDSDLERRPVIYDGAKWIVLLPTAISISVRHRVLSWMFQQGYQDSFDRFFIAEYQDFLTTTPVLGRRIPRDMTPPSKRVVNSSLLEIFREVDAGRYLQVIAVIDALGAFVEYGFSAPELDVSQLSEEVQLRINNARAHFRRKKGFKQGLTLLVWCGYGRPGNCDVPVDTQDWRIEVVSAPDLETLSSLHSASPLFLWKLVDHERFLAQHDISITNPNGLLNLYSWWSQTHFMMIDQRIEIGKGRPVNLMIPTDCLAAIRRKVRQGWDLHSLPLPNGKMMRVIRKVFESFFPEDAGKPNYGCIDEAARGKLLGAWVGRRLIWWVAADPDRTSLSRDMVFQIWDAVSNWLEKAVPIFEKEAPNLRKGAVLIDLDLSEAHEMQAEPVSEEVLRSCLSVTVNSETRTIQIVFHDPFFGGFAHPKNIGERTILRALTDGVLQLGGYSIDALTLDELIKTIVPDEDARHLHFFKAAHFRDYIRDHDSARSIFIDDADEARTKLETGWLVKNRSTSDHLATAQESVPFLNDVVDAIWRRMRGRLGSLDRLSLIEQALRHVEGIEADRLQWERTSRAVLSLKNDRSAAKTAVVRQLARFNAATLSLRLVVEMATSECPLVGGDPVGSLDLQSLMSDALSMFHLGGWSDAIIKGVMQPEIKIAANGEILSHIQFRDEIVEPFGVQFASVYLDNEMSGYEKHFEPVKAIPSVDRTFPDQFLKAFKKEFGLSIDEIRGFRDTLEQFALDQRRCVFVVRREEIIAFCATSKLTNAEIAKVMLDRFELWPRQGWDTTPKGFKSKDWYPWRFGRRLSLIWRPLVRLEDGENSRYVVSPGLIGTNLMHVIRLYYEGGVPIDQCVTPEMRRWIGDEVNRRGHAFASRVFDVMKGQNNEARLEVAVSSLLNESLEQDYGDIDVLAWRIADKVVLAIECKDLKLAKTPNEIADQLNRFSGQRLASGERDDLLKHLDRCDLLRQRSERLAKYLGIERQSIQVKTVVCFSHRVPMHYVSERFPHVSFTTIEELQSSPFRVVS